MSLEIEVTKLPTEGRRNFIAFPTYDRYETSLPNAVGTVSDAINDAGIGNDSAILISDGTPASVSNADKAAALGRYYERSGYGPRMPIYLITNETQSLIIDEVVRKTGLPKDKVEAVMMDPSCGGNRQKAQVVVDAYIADTNRSSIMGLIDDDLEVARTYEYVTGYKDQPNSQIIIDLDRKGDGIDFERRTNGSINTDFLGYAGKTLEELRKKHPGFKATHTWKDTMHRQLNVAQESGAAIFEINPAGESIKDAKVWGVSAIKHRRPDYRTIEVAKASLIDEFPTHELPIESFPAGPSVPFAFRTCNTNVDAAFSAWYRDDITYRLPFSFIISPDISRQNPLQTVTTRTRADNELLPTLLPRVEKETGMSLVYVTGPDFHVEHLREASGYRPSILEQACTSLVDNLYAQAANELMQFKDGFPILDEAEIDSYRIPEERARNVFKKLQELASISQIKIYELLRRTTQGQEEEQELEKNMQKYRTIYQSLKSKLGVTRYEQESQKEVDVTDWDNAAFSSWKEEIDITGRRQLRYYNDILVSTPIITRAIKTIIAEGRYPIALARPDNASTISHPGTPTHQIE